MIYEVKEKVFEDVGFSTCVFSAICETCLASVISLEYDSSCANEISNEIAFAIFPADCGTAIEIEADVI